MQSEIIYWVRNPLKLSSNRSYYSRSNQVTEQNRPQPTYHSLQCPLCDKMHRTKRNLTRHLWTNHREYARQNGIPTEDEICQVCGSTMRRDNLRRHEKTHRL